MISRQLEQEGFNARFECQDLGLGRFDGWNSAVGFEASSASQISCRIFPNMYVFCCAGISQSFAKSAAQLDIQCLILA